jgi:hypothetical protein
MDCKTAQHVWNHKGGLIDGLNCQRPGLIDHLSQLVLDFKNGQSDPFDAAVKVKVGEGPYRVTHSDGVSKMSQWVHDVLGDQVARRIVEKMLGSRHGIRELRLANICCSGCKVSQGDLGEDLDYRIQLAAVNTNPDGSNLALA